MTSLVAQARSAWSRALAKSFFGSHVALATGASLVGGALGFITGPLVARLLGPHGRGELAAIQSWPFLLMTFAALGLHEATIYFSARQPQNTARYLVAAVVLALAASVPIIGLSYLFMPVLLAAQSAEVVSTARWYLLQLPLAILIAMPLGAIRGQTDLVTWNILRLAQPLGWLAVLLVASIWAIHSVQWIAAAYLVMLLCVALLVWTVAMLRVKGVFRLDWREWRPMLRYGLPTMASQAPSSLNLRFDQMLMAAMLASNQLGLYAVAVAWSSALSAALAGIGVAVFPIVAAQSTSQQQGSILVQATRLGTMAAVVLGVLLAIAAPFAIPGLFGPDFAAAVPAAELLIIAGVVAEINNILREGVRGLGATGALLYSEVFGLIVTVVALAALLSTYGIIGAAIASLLGYSTSTVFLVIPIRRTTGCSTAALFCPQYKDLKLIWQRASALKKGRTA